MSYYPTYTTLAAFRRSIGFHTLENGAWPHEREHGIGFRETDRFTSESSHHRREANRMRHEAYERMEGYAETSGRGSPFTESWDACILTFTPGATIHPPERLPDPPRIYPSSWDDDVMSAWHEHQRLHS